MTTSCEHAGHDAIARHIPDDLLSSRQSHVLIRLQVWLAHRQWRPCFLAIETERARRATTDPHAQQGRAQQRKTTR